MADSSLQDRLREHAKAFDGLLSLIPAKMYYGEDNSDQWNRKKQTKAEAKAARMSKLDPDSDLNRSAKEVMEERAKNKRKLQEIQRAEKEDVNDNDNGDEVIPGVTKEVPGEGLRRKVEGPHKKQKLGQDGDEDRELEPLANVPDDNPADMTQEELMRAANRDGRKAERKAKQARKAEKKAQKKAAKAAAAAANKTGEKGDETGDKASNGKPAQSKKQSGNTKATNTEKKAEDEDADDGYETVSGESDAEEADAGDAKKTATTGATSTKSPAPASAPTEAEPKPADSIDSSPRSASQSPVFDGNDNTTAHQAASSTGNEAASTTTSINSTVPPSEKPKQIKIPQDTSALKARLAARIAELQAARKAIGPDGKPIRTRQELIEAQRARQEQRKAHKRELRRQAKLEEERKRDEALASNSPSIMSPALDHLLADEDDDEGGPTDYAFGRVVFNDDTRLSRDLTYELQQKKKKGPSDPKTALSKLQNQKKRTAALDEVKQNDIAEKEAWLIARRRAEGERIRDDEALLKKAVKRKEKQKKKTEREWKERSEGVQRAVREKQKKRDENLKKRREDKKLGRAGRKAVAAASGKKKGRPGFEGGGLGMGGGGGRKKK
ncbi:SURF6-domain-containing protein [Sodiomyces alkalinus F11]|uniref:SURF6-domain-containing protein n=1 Tax=Sodiomyces alkalinus (strain CBS 110278 / VKM F-3762 / F11) TaxID=1314773 RepID=A0A3N2Q7J3_SODAK|nr:SURF6-domain-containing protein [Sodiomyces alkalinus F11]ROT42753.1 SURF6-domain-containing protein [Sodiomyces alkalinus F11]